MAGSGVGNDKLTPPQRRALSALLRNCSDDVRQLNCDVLRLSPAPSTPAGRPEASEEEEQRRLFALLTEHADPHPELALLFHIPNGGYRHKAVAGKLKAAGVRAGVPDLCLPVPRGGYHGLWIEIKAAGGRLSPAQRRWLEALRSHGYACEVCVGAEAALAALLRYLALDN